MAEVRVNWTGDIRLDDIQNLRNDLVPDFEIEINDYPRLYRAGGFLPSWVRLYSDADWWIKLLGPYAALYVAKIVEEAAKDTWKNRAKVGSAVLAAGTQIKRLATALAELRKRLMPKTRIEIALPFPDEYDGTILELLGTDAEEFLDQLSIFVHHLPALLALIRSERLDRRTVATGIQLSLSPDLALELQWQDAALSNQRRVIAFNG